MKNLLIALTLLSPTLAQADDATTIAMEYDINRPLGAGHAVGQGLLITGVALGPLSYVSAVTTPSRGPHLALAGAGPVALTIGGLGMLSVGTSFALRERKTTMLPMLGMAVGSVGLIGLAAVAPTQAGAMTALYVLSPVVLGLGVVQIIANEHTANKHRNNSLRISVAPLPGGGMAQIGMVF